LMPALNKGDKNRILLPLKQILKSASIINMYWNQ
jgi:hypothetical protein